MEEYVETIIEDTEESEIIEFYEDSDESLKIFENVLNEVDPTVPSWVKEITEENISNWNKKATITDMENYIEENKDSLKGEKGDTGKDGVNGKDGTNGKDGQDGYTPIKGKDYFDGKDGTNGKDGIDGKTPVKGVDYYTKADKQEIVNLVLNELPSSEGVSY